MGSNKGLEYDVGNFEKIEFADFHNICILKFLSRNVIYYKKIQFFYDNLLIIFIKNQMKIPLCKYCEYPMAHGQ